MFLKLTRLILLHLLAIPLLVEDLDEAFMHSAEF
jgi:hypothetical protein